VLLNGYSTQTKNIEALQLARDSAVIKVSLPGHTTHRLQPLDMAFSRPLSSHYIDEIVKCLRASRGRCVTQANVALFSVMRAECSYCGQNNLCFPVYGNMDSKHLFQHHHVFTSLGNTHIIIYNYNNVF
jgi:hypothetical protein